MDSHRLCLIFTLITVVLIVGLRLPLSTLLPIILAIGVAIITWLLGAAWRRWTLLG